MLNKKLWSCNEWDTLKEVIIGNPFNARYPYPDKSSQLAEFPHLSISDIPVGQFPQWIIDETDEDLTAFSEELVKIGITVKRPETLNHAEKFSTLDWETAGYYNYCPRDILLVVGDKIIETPNTIRGRTLEKFSYRKILMEYFEAGANWSSAPQPMLRDSVFNVDLSRPVPKNEEPIFDAANVLRFGEDLIYLISSTGNDMGLKWLQSALGNKYRVHRLELKDKYYGSHIDTTVVALRPGLLLLNPERIQKADLPEWFQGWDVIYSPEMEGLSRYSSEYLKQSIGSNWIDMNLFSLSPDLVVVSEYQTQLIKIIESHGINVLPLKLRHSKMLGGGFHCVTLDTRREGKLENYFI